MKNQILRLVSILLLAIAGAMILSPALGADPSLVFVVLVGLAFVPAPRGILAMGVQTVGQRIIFENAKKTLDANGIKPEQAILTQSYLRLEQPLSTTATNYLFPVLLNQQAGGVAQTITERRLQLQDSFVVSELAVYVWVSAGSPATTHFYSYPNFFIFAANAGPLQVLYHSYLTLSVNNQVIVPFWDVWRSYLTSQTQNMAALAAASPDDQLSGRDDVFYPTEPNWILIGSKNNVLQLVMPNAPATITANTKIVIYARGVLAQNSTSVQ